MTEPWYNFAENSLRENPDSVRAAIRQYLQARAITETEARQDLWPLNEEYADNPVRLPNRALAKLGTCNVPFRTLVMLLTGVHSVNICTNKGSIYRMRFVAPSPSSSASTPEAKPSAAAVAGKASQKATTSAAYPLLILYHEFSFKWLRWGYEHAHGLLDEKFSELVDAEMEALDALSTCDSSSATDTNWLQVSKSGSVKYNIINYCHSLDATANDAKDPLQRVDTRGSGDPDAEQNPVMYTQQNNPDHMMLERKRA